MIETDIKNLVVVRDKRGKLRIVHWNCQNEELIAGCGAPQLEHLSLKHKIYMITKYPELILND